MVQTKGNVMEQPFQRLIKKISGMYIYILYVHIWSMVTNIAKKAYLYIYIYTEYGRIALRCMMLCNITSVESRFFFVHMHP